MLSIYLNTLDQSRAAVTFYARNGSPHLELVTSPGFPPSDLSHSEPLVLAQLALLEQMRVGNEPYGVYQKQIERALQEGYYNAKGWRKYGWFHLSAEYEDTVNVRVLTRDAFYSAVIADPTDWLSYRDLGEIYLINRDHEKAYVCFHEACRLNPLDPEPKARMALAAVRLGRIGEARAFVEEVKRAAGSDTTVDPMTFDSAGMVKLLLGEFDEAEELLRKALSYRPHYPYFLSHIRLLTTERSDHASRISSGRRYTPLYIRQRGGLRYFDDKEAPPSNLIVLEWLKDGVAALKGKRSIKPLPYSTPPEGARGTLRDIHEVKREWFNGRSYSEQLHALLSATDLDHHWEAFTQLVYQLFLKDAELREAVTACREHPFGSKELLALSRALQGKGELELAVTIGLRAVREDKRDEELESYLTSCLDELEIRHLLTHAELDDQGSLARTLSEGEGSLTPRRRYMLERGLLLLRDDVPGDLRRKRFAVMTGGILTHLPKRMSFYRQRIDGAAFIREGICRFNRVVELFGLSFRRILHPSEPLSEAYARVIGELFRVPVKELDKSVSHEDGLVVIYNLDLLDLDTIFYLQKRRREQILLTHAMRIGYHSLTPDVVNHLYQDKSDERADEKALRNVSRRVVEEVCGRERFDDLLELEGFLRFARVVKSDAPERFSAFPEAAGISVNPLVLPIYGVESSSHDSFASLLVEAETQLFKKSYPEAIALCQVLLEMNPSSIPALQLMARAMKEMGDVSGACTLLEGALLKAPENTMLMQLVAEFKYDIKAFDQVITLLLASVGGMTEKLSVRHVVDLASSYLYEGDAARAEELFKRAVELDPATPLHYLGWSAALERRGKGHLAIPVMLKAEERCGPLLPICEKLAELYYRTCHFEQAIGYITKALNHHSNAQFYLQRALNHLAMSNAELALEDCRSALDKDPTYGPAMFYRAKILAGMGDRQKAIQWFTESIVAEYWTDAALYYRAGLHEAEGELEKALADMKRARSISTDPLYWSAYLRLEGKLRRQEENVEVLEKLPLNERVMITVPFAAESIESIRSKIEQFGGRFIDERSLEIDGRRYFYLFLPPDENTQRSFYYSGLFNTEEADLLGTMKTVLSLWSFDQSMRGVTEIIRASRALYEAGGLAIKMETAGRGWPRKNWEFILNQEVLTPIHLYLFCIAIVTSEGRYFTCGMHQMGFPDVEVVGSPEDPVVAKRAEVFCLYNLGEAPAIRDLDTMSLPIDLDGSGGSFRISYGVYEGYHPEGPHFNRYGLCTIGDEEQIATSRGGFTYLKEQTGMLRHPDPAIRRRAVKGMDASLLIDKAIQRAFSLAISDPLDDIRVWALTRLVGADPVLTSLYVAPVLGEMLHGTEQAKKLAFEILYKLDGIHLETLANFLRSKERFPSDILPFVRKLIEKADLEKLLQLEGQGYIQ